jgi:hypothetical protein
MLSRFCKRYFLKGGHGAGGQHGLPVGIGPASRRPFAQAPAPTDEKKGEQTEKKEEKK